MGYRSFNRSSERKHEKECTHEAEAVALEEQLHLKALKPKSTTIASVTE
jgi:hypothetical protein